MRGMWTFVAQVQGDLEPPAPPWTEEGVPARAGEAPETIIVNRTGRAHFAEAPAEPEPPATPPRPADA